MIRQFKLSTGEEIVCEVMNEDNVGPQGAFLLVRNCVYIDTIQTPGTRYHTLRPFMTNQDKYDQIMSVYIPHIVAQAIPEESLLSHYMKYVTTESEETEEKNIETDSDSKNVVKFPSRTLH